jgi:hypothetical protein
MEGFFGGKSELPHHLRELVRGLRLLYLGRRIDPVLRGSDYFQGAGSLSFYRYGDYAATEHREQAGFRCARST